MPQASVTIFYSRPLRGPFPLRGYLVWPKVLGAGPETRRRRSRMGADRDGVKDGDSDRSVHFGSGEVRSAGDESRG